ncbi:Methylthioribulose-1-phosphate dehydratase, partial [Dinochytrium kinnereticum]
MPSTSTNITSEQSAAGHPPVTIAETLPYETVVVDIEGTTTPISFVHDVLFPYVTDTIETFLKERWESSELQDKIEGLR